MAKRNDKDNSLTGHRIAGRQTFSLMAPGAESVKLAGDFTQWQEKPIALRKNADGLWQVTVDLGPGAHRYRFIVDGQWQDDPQCALREANPYGGQNAIRQVA